MFEHGQCDGCLFPSTVHTKPERTEMHTVTIGSCCGNGEQAKIALNITVLSVSKIERERKERTRSEEAPCSGLLSTVVFWQQGCYWVRHDKLMGQVWGTGQDRRRKSGGVRENWVWVSRSTHPVPSRREREGRTFWTGAVLCLELTFLSSFRL